MSARASECAKRGDVSLQLHPGYGSARNAAGNNPNGRALEYEIRVAVSSFHTNSRLSDRFSRNHVTAKASNIMSEQ
ncbi:hypothetical protein PRIPAC_78227 [Pristionchus pacificus]|uniref:Uncharacterized protein n=1 Tax=Pristionchus pacificus TaxID=54126 RepID=A0A2A6BH70_PRIPA|nr:hypothetical protein PRIPAC_78227 [Pristionchus pacificus]|eukprot:PDM65188.1 hypothetical protein PRIPAC_52130 [Pristionchus pacificus]